MRKVLFYCHVFYPEKSGYSHAFQNLIYTLLDKNKDLEITVTTPYPIKNNQVELNRERLNIIRLQPKIKIRKFDNYINELFYAKEVSKIFKKGNYNLLFIETFDHTLFLNSLDKNIYDSLVVRVHATNETEYTFFEKKIGYQIRKYIINSFLIKKIKWIVSTNKYHIDFIKKYYFKNNIISISNVNFLTLPNTILPLNKLTFKINKKLKFFLLGRMNRLGNNQKGFTDFIFALKLLDKSLLDKIEIKIVGKGEMREKLIQMSSDINNITFIESMEHDEVISNLIESDVVVLPSRYEGLSMFALEALATGNICIFSKTGGLIELVDRNGFLFNPQDIEELSNILQKVICSSKKDIIKMKRRSLEIYEEKFSPEKISDKFNSIFKILQVSK